MTPAATDIILLAHNRLEHLIATVEALEERTPEPIRITVVDNASAPDVRNWLGANRHRFHKVILRPTNEHVPAFQHGIDATTSDPYIVSDPDIVVPDLQPSWLARLHGLMERHPEFGLIGIGLDQANRPSVLGPEVIDPATVVDDEIVATGVGTVMQMIRRDALVTAYRSDWQTCTDITRSGRRVGWAEGIRGVHLGWDDYRLYPAHLAAKHLSYGVYNEMDLIGRPPTLTELAVAGPVVRLTREAGLADAALLEVTWNGPAVGAALPASVCVERPEAGALPFQDGAAGAVVLVDPPAAEAERALAEATRVGTRMVVAIAPLEAFGARTAAELAPAGWTGEEADGPGDVPLALALAADRDPELAANLGPAAVQDREQWLELFGRGAFGKGTRRLWIWRREEELPAPERVVFDPALVQPWRGVAPPMAQPRRKTFIERLWRRADLAERARLWIALRRRSGEARA
ncbi:glycosyltransferase [Solirubrobacter phytolaccae]|uniref:Glycosyltransferase n=1 Tax=Solirubrobacter phytolaccae TaxID=1404360 RepID=A0A9X3N5M1_9ACTN|nr:glycosyltransferase [Solirubrobacter phytolaccae]MDA0180310.1 glycosyltransferase [Solirubrobacter phytolaccae]